MQEYKDHKAQEAQQGPTQWNISFPFSAGKGRWDAFAAPSRRLNLSLDTADRTNTDHEHRGSVVGAIAFFVFGSVIAYGSYTSVGRHHKLRELQRSGSQLESQLQQLEGQIDQY